MEKFIKSSGNFFVSISVLDRSMFVYVFHGRPLFIVVLLIAAYCGQYGQPIWIEWDCWRLPGPDFVCYKFFVSFCQSQLHFLQRQLNSHKGRLALMDELHTDASFACRNQLNFTNLSHWHLVLADEWCRRSKYWCCSCRSRRHICIDDKFHFSNVYGKDSKIFLTFILFVFR